MDLEIYIPFCTPCVHAKNILIPYAMRASKIILVFFVVLKYFQTPDNLNKTLNFSSPQH